MTGMNNNNDDDNIMSFIKDHNNDDIDFYIKKDMNMKIDMKLISEERINQNNSILSSLPSNGNLVMINNDGHGIIKQPMKYDLKHAIIPLNYREGPDIVQQVESYIMSLAQFQKKLPMEFNEKRKSNVTFVKKTKVSKSR